MTLPNLITKDHLCCCLCLLPLRLLGSCLHCRRSQQACNAPSSACIEVKSHEVCGQSNQFSSIFHAHKFICPSVTHLEAFDHNVHTSIPFSMDLSGPGGIMRDEMSMPDFFFGQIDQSCLLLRKHTVPPTNKHSKHQINNA